MLNILILIAIKVISYKYNNSKQINNFTIEFINLVMQLTIL